jgi:hypothetical protein
MDGNAYRMWRSKDSPIVRQESSESLNAVSIVFVGVRKSNSDSLMMLNVTQRHPATTALDLQNE